MGKVVLGNNNYKEINEGNKSFPTEKIKANTNLTKCFKCPKSLEHRVCWFLSTEKRPSAFKLKLPPKGNYYEEKREESSVERVNIEYDVVAANHTRKSQMIPSSPIIT